jgi:hypothetical protein
MSDEKGPPEIHEILMARVFDSVTFALIAIYDEHDPGLYVSKLGRLGPEEDAMMEVVFDTNDGLSQLWISPSGSIWMGSVHGNLYTTAKVSWPPPTQDDLDCEVVDPSYPFEMTTLPDFAGGNYAPNVSALWGTSDDHVFIGTFEGAIYHWDGKTLRQANAENRRAINEIHGSGPDDIYFVGRDGLILHFDGQAIRPLPYPDDAGSRHNITGVRALSFDEVFMCTDSGQTLHGSRHGLEVLAQFGESFYRLAHFEDRLFLAAGNAGLYELIGNATDVARDTFTAVGVYEGNDRMVMIPAESELSLTFYVPSEAEPWFGAEF